jgi:hypothetical protein
MRRAVAAAMFAAFFLATASKAAPMTDDFSFPPWTPGPGETSAVAGKAFADCESVLADWAGPAHAEVEARTYTTSRAWGDILRAKVGISEGGDTSVHLFTCWTGDGHGVRFAFRPERMLDDPPASP